METSPGSADTPRGTGTAPAPRTVDAAAGAAWWGESWHIFLAAPLPWLGIVVVFAVVSMLLFHLPVIGGMAQSVLTPVFAGGVMLGCHALARGDPLSVGHLFEGFQKGRFGPLFILGLLWLALLAVLAIVAVSIAFVALGASGVAALMALGSDAQTDFTVLGPLLASAGIVFIVLILFVLGVVLVAAMAYWFAPALVVLDGEAPWSALRKSFDASLENFGAFLVYGLIYIGLAIVASIPVFLGWLVLGPMVTGSCYAGWRTIFGATGEIRPATGPR